MQLRKNLMRLSDSCKTFLGLTGRLVTNTVVTAHVVINHQLLPEMSEYVALFQKVKFEVI